MSNTVFRARMAAIWCMSVLTIGALSIVLGAALTILNGELLVVACAVPPLITLIVWRHAAPIALALAS